MTLYEAIEKRRSVRKFRMTAIEPKLMVRINQYIDTLSAFHPEAGYRIAVVEALGVKEKLFRGMFLTEAPYYLILSAKKHPYAAINAGYVMEQLVLYLTSKGLATCYLGNAKTTQNLDGRTAMIVVAFGRAEKALPKEQHRKELSQLLAAGAQADANMRWILEAARKAPSAFNLQPWRFVPQTDRIRIYSQKSMVNLTPRMKELKQISMGICLYHLALAAEEFWYDWSFSQEENSQTPAVKASQYVTTLHLLRRDF